MELNKYIDHTLLKADAAELEVVRICEEAIAYGFASVCVNSGYVPLVAKLLKDSGVKVCSVVGFPLGAMITAAKAYEAKAASEAGADEVDMVINIGDAKSGKWDRVEADVRAVVEAVPENCLVKVIIETCLLTDEEKILACRAAVNAGADYVKTSTGFSTEGANAHDVALMRKSVGESIGVKASGGIRTKETALEMIEAGATRIGASSSIRIVSE